MDQIKIDDQDKSNDQLMFEILDGLKTGSCWCQMGIDNPMVSRHTEICIRAKEKYLQLGIKLREVY